MRVLSLAALHKESSHDVDFELTLLLPHLVGLKHFAGGSYLSMSCRVFRLLAEAAGNTLVSISCLSVAPGEVVACDVFARFQSLTHVEFRRALQIRAGDVSSLESP